MEVKGTDATTTNSSLATTAWQLARPVEAFSEGPVVVFSEGEHVVESDRRTLEAKGERK